MNNPLVSIIIPCYNTASYIEETLKSVLDQTFKKWEAIIVNDDSPDNTEQIIQKWLDKDKRFKYYKKKNGGLADTRIFGIEKSTGKYIFPLDSDDYIDCNYLQKAVNILESDSKIEILYCEVMKFGEQTGVFKLEEFSLDYLLIKNCIISAAFFRKSTYDKVGGYCKSLKFLEDWDLWISILKNGGKVHKINEILFFYRIRKSGSLINNLYHDMNLYNEYHDIIFKRHLDAFLEHIGNPFLIKRDQLELEKYKNKVQSNRVYRLFQFLKRIKSNIFL